MCIRDRSETSKATYKAQGGPLSEAECRRFEEHPGFARALDLRTYDDLAKDPDAVCPNLESYRDLMNTLVLR